MYEEKRSSGLGSIILKFILIVAAIFLIIGIFPTKAYVKGLLDSKIGVSSNAIFNYNIHNMKEAALSYYSGDRLPDKVSRMTLKQMQDKNIITDVKDSNDDSCDVSKSYVKISKEQKEYKLEVNLVCKNKNDKIISYYNPQSCTITDTSSKKKITKEDNIENPKDNNNSKEDINTKTQQNTETKQDDSNNRTQNNYNKCKYVKNISGYTNWSNWSKQRVSSTSTRQVQTKVVKEKVGTIQERSGNKVITQNPKKVTGTYNGKPFVIYVCPSDFDNGGKYKVAVKCRKTVANYVTKDSYKNIVYYRYRDYYSNKSYKESNCNDTNLLNQGYIVEK